MNRIRKLIWPKTFHHRAALSERVTTAWSAKGPRRRIAAPLFSSIALSTPALAQSVLPSGGKIVSGQATITVNGNAMTVRQSTDKLIANWQDFSIGKNAAVTFRQPNASSVALNRVVGQSPSQILGALDANGRVFLVNPNGVLIGAGASVQTGAFIASTLGLPDQDFLAGKYRFGGEGRAIVNRGNINGNVVALIAPSVSNEGSITGSTALAAGTDVLLDFNGDGLLSVQMGASTLAALVENKGLIRADGGIAILTAKGASDALKGVVNNTGTVQARTIANRNGRILLLGDMEHGEANIGGTLDASALQEGDGGSIETSAARVNVADSARVTTRASGGKTGVWLIDPNDFTIAAMGGNITGSALSSQLAGSNVTISTATQGTAGGNGDIFVKDTVNWPANTLTLHAERNIVINSTINGSATAGLALEYGQGAAASGNTATYSINAPVNLDSTGSFSTKLGSDGTTASYAIVTSLGNAASSNDGTLQGIAGNLGGRYVLGADIDASASNAWNSSSGFTPIGSNATGNASSRLTGTFDGLGHVITGLAINRPASNFVGLFGYVDTAGAVRNVGLNGGSVSGNSRVGQLAGAINGSISGSYATGSVSGTDTVGGLVGKNFGTITSSYSTGPVSGQSLVGGLVGFNQGGTVSQTYAAGAVTASAANSQAGGLVGYLNGGTITNSYATGSVSGNISVGGLIGFDNSGTVNHTYATGQVTGSDANYVGGLAGFVNSGTSVSNSYWDTSTTGQSLGCGIASSGTCNAIGLNTAQMKSPFSLIDAGWDFQTIWGKSRSGGNSGYMVLRALDGTAYDDYVRLSNANLAKTYGDANPPLSGITMDGVGTNNVSLAWGSAITATTSAGSYAYGTPNVLDVAGTNGRNAYVDYGNGTLSIAKAPLTVTANNASKTYDGQAFAGGNGVGYSGLVNGETASVLSGTVSYGGTAQGAVNAGSYTLSPSGLSSSNYDISYGNGILSIAKAPLTVTANNASKTYDGQAFAGGNGVSYSGLVNGETASVLSGTVSYGGTAQGAVNAGSYTLSPSGLSSSNYDISYGNGILSIAKAPLTVTANNASKTYDGQAFAGGNGVSYSGLVNGETASVLSGTVSYGGTAQGAVNVGGYTLSPSGLSSNNYDISYANGALTVVKAPLTVTANNASKTYDGQAFAGGNGVGYSGLVNGETASVLSGTVSYGGTAQGAVNAGSYTLSPSGLSSSNYDISYGNGILSIAKAPLTVTANNASKTYDGQAFAGGNGVSYSGLVNVETASVLSGTVSYGGTAQGAVNAGGYTLSPSGLSSNNYDISYANGALTVAKAPLTVTANNASKTYDGQAFAGGNGVGYSGLVNGETASVLSGTVSYGGTAQGAINAGSYTLSLSGLSSNNYDISYANGALTVAKAPLTVTANNASKTYDGQAFAGGNGVGYSGLVNGETASVLSGTVSYGGTAQGAVNAGSYTLAPSGLSSSNYNISYADGTLNINKAIIPAITGISANNKIYDGTAVATLNTSGAVFTGMVAGDKLTVASATGTFHDKTPGMSKTVFITGLSLGGADAGNYSLSSTTATAAANINTMMTPPMPLQQAGIGSMDINREASIESPALLSIESPALLSIEAESLAAGAMPASEGKAAQSRNCMSGKEGEKTARCVVQGQGF